MKVSELIKFRSDLFFDGAVQLGWADQNKARASEAARTFVFHGPQYHGVSKDTGADEAYRLTDTATLIADLFSRISQGNAASATPFSLAIAGYGSGKSHFAVALTYILRNQNSDIAKEVLKNLASADASAAKSLGKALANIDRPALVVPLDGTGNFNLGNALSSALFRSLKESGLDDAPLRELSPRFDDAANFVRRNFTVRLAEFSSRFGARREEEIISGLASRDEETYSIVDEIYLHANGAHIPVEGRESAQDLISTFCDVYCGAKGPFSRLVIVFDEFGRFLEYVAERPALAGDSALQQIFQGIQDNGDRAHFIGFIQYELKAYLARLGQRDAMHIQKYITRFDVAKKYYLSSNLETIIAHLLEKADSSLVNSAIDKEVGDFHVLHKLMNSLLPGFGKIPVWNDYAEFEQVIVRGCWPLHPLATWFLTRQQDIVQSRSAITFVKNALDGVSNRNAISHSRLLVIPGSRVVAGEMLNEMLAAERAHGGVVVENLIDTLRKYEAQLEESDRYLLVAVAAAKKMRVVSRERSEYDRLLGAFAGLGADQYQPQLSRLELELGILAWSSELNQYELITDAATRGQYQKELRKKVEGVSRKDVSEVFVGRAKAWTEDLFQDITTPFGQNKGIPTLEWSFVSHLANEQSVFAEIQNAFSDWRQASRPDQAKGQVIFAYLNSEVNIPELQEKIVLNIKAELKKSNCSQAPVWVVLLGDLAGRIQGYLTTLYVLEDGFEAQDKDRYSRFIPEARETAMQGLRSALREAILNRISIYSGLELKPSRLVADATKILEQVYSKALPFPFDGFSSKAGNGGTDAAVIARALFGRELSGAWLDVQVPRLQNRVRTLLGGSWGALDPQGKVRAVLGNLEFNSLLDGLEKIHKKSSATTLKDDLLYLLRPPYGFNLASAAILLGLFVGKSIPPRAIQYESNGVGLQEWLRVAFGAKGRFLDEVALSKTTITFLSEDAVARWQLILQHWEVEVTLEGIVDQRDAAMEQRQKDPVPEPLEIQFKYLCEKADRAADELSQHIGALEDCEERLEVALKRRQYNELFAVADRLLRKSNDMTVAKEKWTKEQIKEVGNSLDELRELLEKAAPEWIQSQSCNSPQQVTDYRIKMERAAKTLSNLGLAKLAQRMHDVMVQMISSVEKRFRFKLAIDEATDLNRLPEPVPSSRIREVRDVIESAEKIIGILSTAITELGDTPDLNGLRESLKQKQDRLRKFVKSRQAECSRQFDLIPGTTEEVNDLLSRLVDLKHQFAVTADAEDLERRASSALQVGNAFRQLSEIDADPESIASRLRTVISSFTFAPPEVNSEDAEDEQNPEALWIDDCFEKHIANRISAVASRSQDWAMVAIKELEVLSTDQSRLSHPDSLIRYENVPVYLAKKDRDTVNSKVDSVRRLRAEVVEKDRMDKAKSWLSGLLETAKVPESLSRELCGQLLQKLQQCPSFIGETEFERVAKLRTSLERRLDELDFSDLVNRIARLTDVTRRALFNELATAYGVKLGA